MMLKSEKLQKAIGKMPDIDPASLSPELQASLANVLVTLDKLKDTLDEVDDDT